MSEYTAAEKQALLNIARNSIYEGLTKKQSIQIRVQDCSESLRQIRACFVTLEKNGVLRGCIGSLQAYRPIAEDVASNAFSAAFRDSRFHVLTLEEYQDIGIHISILSIPEFMHFNSEEDLVRQIRPGIDGLILTDGGHRGTFLPSVWEQIPNANLFLMHLKNKAGLPSNYWSNTLQVERYITEVIE